MNNTVSISVKFGFTWAFTDRLWLMWDIVLELDFRYFRICRITTWILSTHFVDYVMRQSGQDSERVSKVGDDVHDVLHHIRREAGLHGGSFHPLGEVVCHSQNVFVSIQCLGQRTSDIQTKPLPRLCHLPSQHDIMEIYNVTAITSVCI